MRLLRLWAITCLTGFVWAGDASWDPKSAAAYLDSRMDWWSSWKTSARDHDTFCVSCHTALPYALSRSALRGALKESGPSPNEQKLIDNVAKRVRLWNEVDPYYPDTKNDAGKTLESWGTEAVLNALVLVSNSAPGTLTPDAELALQNLWAQQIKSGDDAGAWPWLQFHNAPWEGDSQFFGTTLAAIAIGRAPAKYRSGPEQQTAIKQLGQYLSHQQKAQKLIDRMMLVWAAAKLPDLLTAAERQSIVAEALSKQQEDGGFSLSQFVGGWKRRDNTPLETRSDGYATGVVAFALEQAGINKEDPILRKSLLWLASHQEPDGRWAAWSLNKQRELASDAGRFMSDAATAYAVLALDASTAPGIPK